MRPCLLLGYLCAVLAMTAGGVLPGADLTYDETVAAGLKEFQAQDYDAARAHFEAAQKLQPAGAKQSLCHLYLGQICAQQDDNTGALREFHAVISAEKDPAMVVEAKINAGSVLTTLKRYDNAVSLLVFGVRGDGATPRLKALAQLYLAKLFFIQGNLDAAIPMLVELTQNTQDADVSCRGDASACLGQIYMSLGLSDLALETYTKMLTEPDLPTNLAAFLLMQKGQLLSRTRQNPQAIQALTQLVAKPHLLWGIEGQSLLVLGEAQMATGQIDAGLAAYDRILQTKSLDAHFHVYALLGKMNGQLAKGDLAAARKVAADLRRTPDIEPKMKRSLDELDGVLDVPFTPTLLADHPSKWTIWHIRFFSAIRQDDVTALAKLMDLGLPVDLPREPGSPILGVHMAATVGADKCMALLIDRGADITTKIPDGMTPLLLAAITGHTSTVEVLLAHQADPLQADRNGDTAVHIACSLGNLDLVKALIAAKVDVNLKGGQAMTPLHFAAHEDHRDIVDFLLAQGADGKALASFQLTPFGMLQSRPWAKSYVVLKKFGAGPGKPIDARPGTGLNYAATPVNAVIPADLLKTRAGRGASSVSSAPQSAHAPRARGTGKADRTRWPEPQGALQV